MKIIQLSEFLPNTVAGNHLNGQIVRSGTSPALNYGEAQSAESPKDFIHKMGVCLKELRETFINIKMIKYSEMIKNNNLLDWCYAENNELISIFECHQIIRDKHEIVGSDESGNKVIIDEQGNRVK